jgi:cytochrome c-type biogenesis protein
MFDVAAEVAVDVPFALALTRGAVSAFNPCGFAMLPAYLGAFVNSSGQVDERPATRIVRATEAGALVTAGFLVVFGVIGTIVSEVSASVLKVAPWMTIVIGIVLVGLGIAMLRGFQPKISLPNPAQRAASKAGTLSRRGMFLYGVSYAIVSLGCTLPIFMGQVISTFNRSHIVDGIVLYVAFALGMGLVVITLSIAVSLAQHSFVRAMKNVLPYLQRISALVLIAAGLYVTYYGWYEQRLLNATGNVSGGALASQVTSLSDRFQNAVVSIDRLLIGGVVLLMGLATWAFIAHWQSRVAHDR